MSKSEAKRQLVAKVRRLRRAGCSYRVIDQIAFGVNSNGTRSFRFAQQHGIK